jgi:outer membrane protein assembly factor BamB
MIMKRSWFTGRKRISRRLTFETLCRREMMAGDYLYVGDGHSNTIKRFEAIGGTLVSEYLESSTSLQGPRGMIVRENQLRFVNQNVDTQFNGEVRVLDRRTGAELPAIVKSMQVQAPVAPRGLVQKDNVLFVADAEGPTPRVAKYDASTGSYLGQLDTSGFAGTFQPRGLVFGPDGALYVTGFDAETFDTIDPAGYIFRFDLMNNSFRVIAANNGDKQVQVGEQSDLHNPEGIVFGSDGRIYVTSNQSNTNTKILVMNPDTGRLLDSIPIADNSNFASVTAEALIFGPQGNLYIPITVRSLVSPRAAGGVWKLNPVTKQVDTSFIPVDFDLPIMVQPWYAAFGKSDSATLNYVESPVAPREPELSLVDSSILQLSTGERRYVAPKILINAQDSIALTGATVRIDSSFSPSTDRLLFSNRGSIRGNWNSQTGVLTFSGTDTVLNYQLALRSVLITSSSGQAGSRTVSFVVSDGTRSSQPISRRVALQTRSDTCSASEFARPAKPVTTALIIGPVLRSYVYTVLPRVL